jgi:hypothetical protein
MITEDKVSKLSVDMDKLVEAVSLLLETAMLTVEETDPILSRLLHAKQQVATIKKNLASGASDD